MLSSIAPKPTKLRVVALAFAVAAGLGLSACGGGDDSSSNSDTSTSGATSDIRQQFNDALQQGLAGQQGVSPEVANCIFDKISATVSDAEIQQAVDSGQMPQSILDAATKAGVSCGLSQGG